MNWTLAIEKNREALKRILAMLVAMIEAGSGGQLTFFPPKGSDASGVAQAEKSRLSPALTLPRHLHRFILRLLRPAEAATRRLVIIAARGLVVKLPPLRIAKPKPAPAPVGINLGLANMFRPGQKRVPVPARTKQPTLSLPLLNSLKRFGVRRKYVKPSMMPSITLLGGDEAYHPIFRRPPPPPLPTPDDPLDAGRIHRRLEAIGRVLDDLPRQATRLARWQARRDARLAQERTGAEAAPGDSLLFSASAVPEQSLPHGGKKVNCPQRVAAPQTAKPRFQRLSPMRPGRPPGWRRKPNHDVYEVLNEVHGLAIWVRDGPTAS